MRKNFKISSSRVFNWVFTSSSALSDGPNYYNCLIIVNNTNDGDDSCQHRLGVGRHLNREVGERPSELNPKSTCSAVGQRLT